MHSVVTCKDIINVLKGILMAKTLIAEAEQVCDDHKTLKRSLPGDLQVSSNNWDAMKLTKKKSKKGLVSTPRSSKLMLKGQKGI